MLRNNNACVRIMLFNMEVVEFSCILQLNKAQAGCETLTNATTQSRGQHVLTLVFRMMILKQLRVSLHDSLLSIY